MNKIDQAGDFCPICGKKLSITVPVEHLLPGTVLRDKYVVGYALGQGGFGITYIGFDKVLERKIAIKEYFPTGYVTRINTDHTVSAGLDGSEGESVFLKGKESFLKEARTLAKFSGKPGIVEVSDFFESHNTAYIVMEYLEGITLKEYLKEQGGRLSVEDTLKLITPAMEGLSAVHKQGIVHRDISPDNIMILEDKRIKLLDFGAARDLSAVGNSSLSVMLKPGFAPEEQYRSRGEQGPWTDVYALAATIYKCITGRVPDESTQRMYKDELKKPSEIGVNIEPSCEYALMKGLAVRNCDRYQSVDEFLQGLYSKEAPEEKSTTVLLMNTGSENKNLEKKNSESNTQKVTSGGATKKIIIAIIALLVIGIGLFFFLKKPKEEKQEDDTPGRVVENTEKTPDDGSAGAYNSNDENNTGDTNDNLKESETDLSPAPTDVGISTPAPVDDINDDKSQGADEELPSDIDEGTNEVGNGADQTSEPVDDTITENTPSPTLIEKEDGFMVYEVQELTKKDIEKIIASSTLTETGFDHKVENLLDKNKESCWCEGVEGAGINEYVEVTFKKEMLISEVDIFNGYSKKQKSYENNGRVSKIKIYYTGGSIETDLKDKSWKEVEGKEFTDIISFNTPIETNYIRIVILGAFDGTKFEDTCISELGFKAVSKVISDVEVNTPTATPKPTATPTPEPTATATPVPTATPAPKESHFGNLSKGQIVTFGKYEQDNNISNGSEKLEWLVLNVEESKALLITKYAIDCVPYNSTQSDTSWENSDIRKWLNGDFMNTALTKNERTYVVDSEIESGKDKVFLLDTWEFDTYISAGASICEATPYTISRGAYIPSLDQADLMAGLGLSVSTDHYCCWWLRTPGDYGKVRFINNNGMKNTQGAKVDSNDGAVRPAIWVDLTK